MEFSGIGDLGGTGAPGLSGRWSGLPTSEALTFQDLDSPWKSGHGAYRPSPSTLETQAIRPTQLHNNVWGPFSSGSMRNSSSLTLISRTSSSNSTDWTDSAAPPINEYRPRGPTGKRKGAVRRITPKSKKHAYELSRNRTAATKYRDRQKLYVDGLQEKCKQAETKRQLTISMVQSLRHELLELRREILKHTHCGDSKVREYGYNVDI